MCFTVEINQDVFKYPGFENSYMMHSHMQIQVWSQVGCFTGAAGIHQPTIVGFCGKAQWGQGQGFSWVIKKKKKKKNSSSPRPNSLVFSASHSSSAKEGKGVFVILALPKWIGSMNALFKKRFAVNWDEKVKAKHTDLILKKQNSLLFLTSGFQLLTWHIHVSIRLPAVLLRFTSYDNTLKQCSMCLNSVTWSAVWSFWAHLCCKLSLIKKKNWLVFLLPRNGETMKLYNLLYGQSCFFFF